MTYSVYIFFSLLACIARFAPITLIFISLWTVGIWHIKFFHLANVSYLITPWIIYYYYSIVKALILWFSTELTKWFPLANEIDSIVWDEWLYRRRIKINILINSLEELLIERFKLTLTAWIIFFVVIRVIS